MTNEETNICAKLQSVYLAQFGDQPNEVRYIWRKLLIVEFNEKILEAAMENYRSRSQRGPQQCPFGANCS